MHPILSTSDQTDYKKYPYIAGNILAAVLPEQAAVWSYPVESVMNTFDVDTYESVEQRISKEQVIMNMINSFLGRMHLASAVHLLQGEKKELVKEGITYYDSIAMAKRQAIPYFPIGFTNFHQDKVVSGFLSGKTIYLAVWNMGGNETINVPIKEYTVKNVKIAYPSASQEKVEFGEHFISINLEKGAYTARFLEIEIA